MERFLMPLLEALVGKLMIKQAAMDNRQEMQAQHFDVVERDADRALKRADKAHDRIDRYVDGD